MNANNLILNRLFTQSMFKNLIDQEKNDLFNVVVQRFASDAIGKSYGELIEQIYSHMSKSYRNEYFYQNTLLNKLLLGRHSVNTTTALTQIPIEKSKADFILINGKAIVYEIKSELDNFERLNTQIRDYYKAFIKVCVLTSEKNFEILLKILDNSPVGVCVLTKRNTISRTLIKEPIRHCSGLEHKSIFKVLRKKEFEKIILQFYGKLPQTTQVYYYDECLDLFSKIRIMDAYNAAINQLKARSNIKSHEIKQVPYELKSLAYFSNSLAKDLDKLDAFLSIEYRR